ncbi:adenosylcobinamide-GDP ribazoletransferase [Synergistaceae bacterium OttesenSCG-928-D05]|nr:adenosylcobinamide-GDP ribazoletransferase [Synergistaceae bacterium OttesenSCG-928-D05]
MNFKKIEYYAQQMADEVKHANFRFDFFARFVVIWTLVSRIPLPEKMWPKELVAGNRALPLMPLAGAILGLITGVVVLFCRSIGLNPMIAAWIGAAAYAKSGWALHLDGVADVWDGFGSGKLGEPLRAVMKDSRLGAYGAIGLILVFGIWTSAIASLQFDLLLPACIVAAGVGRFSSCVAAYFGEYPWEAGMGKGWVDTFTQYDLFTAFVCAAVLLIFSPAYWLVAVVLTFAIGMLAAKLSNRWLGGVNGDVLGASAVAGEVCTLLVFLV